jgi:hypothetical protein
MRGCLLASKECVKTVREILRTCLDFCDLLSRLSEEGEWRKNAIIKRRKTTAKTAAEIVNQWTKPDTVLTWIDDVYKLEEVLNEMTNPVTMSNIFIEIYSFNRKLFRIGFFTATRS